VTQRIERLHARWRRTQDTYLTLLAAVPFWAAVLLAIAEIVRRYVFGRTFHWGQDFVIYFMLAGVFLYFGITQARRGHLMVTLLPDALAKGGKVRSFYLLRAFATALTLFFVAGLAYWGWPAFRAAFVFGRRTESLFFPIWPFVLLLLVGLAIMAVTVAFQLHRDLRAVRGRPVGTEDDGEEDAHF
jgi:TRAP-type C4-dicarboxylate transport system permease small subunit